MFTFKKEKQEKSTFEFTADIPWKDIQKEYEIASDKLISNLEIQGFRKGKVPKSIGQKHIKKDNAYKELIQALFPRIYEEIVKKEAIRPIINPKIELVKAKENEDWQIRIKIAVEPEFKLPDIKSIASEVKTKNKKDEIWVPGKDKTKQESDKEKEAYKQRILNEILTLLLNKANIEISDLIIEEELNSRLARLVDDVQKIGLTTESYLKSKNITMDQLKAKYTKEIEDTYKVEFLLNKVADQEKIEVEKEDLENLFKDIKDEKEKNVAKQNSYLYAAVLRKQKTLEYLMNL
jgi:trigger factor